MKVFKLLFVLVVIIQITGCVKNIDIRPDYDEKAKTLSVDSLKFDKVIFSNERKFGLEAGLLGGVTNSFYSVDDSDCSSFQVQVVNVAVNAYSDYTTKDAILNDRAGSCLTRKIGNLNSLRCLTKVSGNISLYLTSTRANEYGYGDKVIYTFRNNQCMKKFENHFAKNLDSNDVEDYEANNLPRHLENFLRDLVK